MYLRMGTYKPILKMPTIQTGKWGLLDKETRKLSDDTYEFKLDEDTLSCYIIKSDEQGKQGELSEEDKNKNKKYKLISQNDMNDFYKTETKELIKFSKDSIGFYREDFIPLQFQYYELKPQ